MGDGVGVAVAVGVGVASLLGTGVAEGAAVVADVAEFSEESADESTVELEIEVGW